MRQLATMAENGVHFCLGRRHLSNGCLPGLICEMSPGNWSQFPQAPWAPEHTDQMRKGAMLPCGTWDHPSMSVSSSQLWLPINIAKEAFKMTEAWVPI